jgi:hypothetical protein
LGTARSKDVAILLLAALISLSSLQGVSSVLPAASGATDPVSSVTVLAGCTYSSSLRFTNNVAQYVTANPQYQRLNFTSSTCLGGGGVGGFRIPQPKSVPPIFFLRGTTVTIKAVCPTSPECFFVLNRNPQAQHDPTSSSVPNLEINLINGSAISITIPPNAGIGRYNFLGKIQVSPAEAPCPLLDPFSAWFWVIYNATPGSTDADVNGLNATAYNQYVLGQTDTAYFGQSTSMSATYSVKTVTNRYMGGPITFTLGPQKAVVYLAAMNIVDNARAWVTANSSVFAIARGASNGLPSGWPVPSGKSLLYDVPLLLTRLQNPTTAATLCGQCMVYGAIGDALSRSIGVPTRMATTINSIARGVMPADKATAPPGAWTWNFHVWDEVWLNQVTRMSWSAFDPSKGNAFGHTPINPIGPIPTNAMPAGSTPATSFARRFATGMLPGAAIGTCPCSSTAFVTSASGTRGTDTAAYVSPLPDPAPPTGPVTVTFDRASYAFGDTIVVNVTVTNPYPFGVSASAEVSLDAVAFGDINLEGPWPVATVNSTIALPPDGVASQTFDFPPGGYQTSGDFVALAQVDLGPSNASGFGYTSVTSGLSLTLSAPSTVSTGQDFNTTVQVTNDLATTVDGATVGLSLPTDVTPLDPANFTVSSIGPGAVENFTIEMQAGSVPELYVISAEASTPGGGTSFGSPIAVNATDPPGGGPLAGSPQLERALPATLLDENSTTIGSATCSISTTIAGVPQFSGAGVSSLASPLLAAAVAFFLLAIGGLVFGTVRRQRERRV